MQYRNRWGCLVHIAKQYENLLINRACHGWCGCNGICSAFVYIRTCSISSRETRHRPLYVLLPDWLGLGAEIHVIFATKCNVDKQK